MLSEMKYRIKEKRGWNITGEVKDSCPVDNDPALCYLAWHHRGVLGGAWGHKRVTVGSYPAWSNNGSGGPKVTPGLLGAVA